MAHTAWSDPVNDLRHALLQNRFRLYCQPIAALFGSVMYPMAEVLVRLSEEEAHFCRSAISCRCSSTTA